MFTAVLVVYSHSFALTGTQGYQILGLDSGQLRVKAFFAICGYLVMKSWLSNPSIKDYAFKRALRIFPPLTIAVVVTIFIIGPITTTLPLLDYFSLPRTYQYLNNILLYPQYDLPAVFNSNIYPSAVNGSLWTIPAEVFLYFLFPVLLLIGLSRYIVLISLALILSSLYATSYYDIQSFPVIYANSTYSFLQVAPYFILGSIFSLLLKKENFSIYIAFILIIIMNMTPSGFVQSVFSVFVITYTWISFGEGYTKYLRIPKRVGDLSYGIFLYSFPIQQMLVNFNIYPTNPYANFFLAATLSATAAYFSWHYLEEPLARFKPKKKLPEASTRVDQPELLAAQVPTVGKV